MKILLTYSISCQVFIPRCVSDPPRTMPLKPLLLCTKSEREKGPTTSKSSRHKFSRHFLAIYDPFLTSGTQSYYPGWISGDLFYWQGIRKLLSDSIWKCVLDQQRLLKFIFLLMFFPFRVVSVAFCHVWYF